MTEPPPSVEYSSQCTQVRSAAANTLLPLRMLLRMLLMLLMPRMLLLLLLLDARRGGSRV